MTALTFDIAGKQGRDHSQQAWTVFLQSQTSSTKKAGKNILLICGNAASAPQLLSLTARIVRFVILI